MNENGFERIVTHNDFDGVVSAAICSAALGCARFFFTGPNSISDSRVSVGRYDIVCDLPCPLECGMWFDHHPGNLEALRLRGIEPDGIPGRFAEKPSCARVVLEYFSEGGSVFPGFFHDTVTEADIIDSFDYMSVEEWRRETPGKSVDMSLKGPFDSIEEKNGYMRHLTGLVRDLPLEEVLDDEEVALRTERYRSEEEKMIEFVVSSISFLDHDVSRELVILDLTGHRRQPRVQRNLAYIVEPEALGVVTVNSLFRGGKKTNDLSFSISLSMNLKGRKHRKDMGEIMRLLNIGDGHTGAAAGTIYCRSKDEMLRVKKATLARIWDIWKSMDPGGV